MAVAAPSSAPASGGVCCREDEPKPELSFSGVPPELPEPSTSETLADAETEPPEGVSPKAMVYRTLPSAEPAAPFWCVPLPPGPATAVLPEALVPAMTTEPLRLKTAPPYPLPPPDP